MTYRFIVVEVFSGIFAFRTGVEVFCAKMVRALIISELIQLIHSVSQ